MMTKDELKMLELENEIGRLQGEINNKNLKIENQEREINRLKSAISGQKVYTPHRNIQLEIDAEQYLANFSDDGVRRHAFNAGVESIFKKIGFKWNS